MTGKAASLAQPSNNPLAGGQRPVAALHAEAEAAVERGYRDGFDQGTAEGLRLGATEGREAAARAAQDAVAARLARLDELLSSLPPELAARVGVSPAQADEVVAKLVKARIVVVQPDGFLVPDAARLRHFLEFLQMKAQFGDVA